MRWQLISLPLVILLIDTPSLGMVAPNYLVILLVIFLVPSTFGFFALGHAALCFHTFNYLAPSASTLSIPGLPAFSYLSSSVVSLVGLDAFFYNFFIAFLIDGDRIKLLVEVITNFFDNNSFIIIHTFDNSYTSKQAPNMSYKIEIINLFLSINIMFNA